MGFSKFNFIIQIWHLNAKMGEYNAKMGNKKFKFATCCLIFDAKKVAFKSQNNFIGIFSPTKKRWDFCCMKSTPESIGTCLLSWNIGSIPSHIM